ncbi:FitA-like ribbon-helix-helix domain-containing protein [Floridanema evergladense]|uniref:Antitoxin FitA-like ribbon-helix-helix domain-containing protein n=1 Tax=Floridaenema evergladense BLCC-F167 TaxID=3153639 RepID=A0ABV4WIX2_9CYAN
MATLTIENLPEDLMAQLQQLASQNNQTINEQIINLLKQAVQKPQPPLKFLISPETDPTWEERRQAVPKLQAEIDQRLEKRRAANLEWLDSNALLREDRDR